MEQWKNVKGYEGLYLISSEGRVFSVRSDRMIKATETRGGYYNVELNLNGKPDKRFLHRLVAETFANNPKGLPIVNHKDENPSNNRADNLEWCTPSYNVTYGTAVERRVAHTDHKRGADNVRSKRVYQFDLQGNLVKEYGGVHDASRETGLSPKSIAKCGTGFLKTYAGYVWRYENKFVLEPRNCPPRKGAVLMFDMNHKLLKQYESSRAVAKDGFRPNDVCRCCRGERNHYAGHIWEYAK